MGKTINQLTTNIGASLNANTELEGQLSGSASTGKFTLTQLKAALDALVGGGDVTPPAVLTLTMIGGEPSLLTIGFDEAVTITTAGFSALKNGVAWAIVSVAAGTGFQKKFTMASPATAGDVITLSYNSATGATTDSSANELVSFTNAPVTNFLGGDSTAPLLTGAEINDSVLNKIFLYYNEALNEASIPAAGSFTLGGTSNTVTSVDVFGNVVHLSCGVPFTIADTGVLVSYTPPGSGQIEDLAGNNAAAISSVAVDNNIGSSDTTAPSPIIAYAGPVATTIVIGFNEAVTLNIAGWSFKKNGSDWPITSVAGSGSGWAFTMSTSGALGDVLLVSYNPATGSTLDLAGNELGAFTDAPLSNCIGGPTLAGFNISSDLPNKIKIYFSDALDESGITPTSAFTVGGSHPQTVFAVDIAYGLEIHLTCGENFVNGDTVTLTYTIPGTNPVKALTGGGLAIPYINAPVTNSLP